MHINIAANANIIAIINIFRCLQIYARAIELTAIINRILLSFQRNIRAGNASHIVNITSFCYKINFSLSVNGTQSAFAHFTHGNIFLSVQQNIFFRGKLNILMQINAAIQRNHTNGFACIKLNRILCIFAEIDSIFRNISDSFRRHLTAQIFDAAIRQKCYVTFLRRNIRLRC